MSKDRWVVYAFAAFIVLFTAVNYVKADPNWFSDGRSLNMSRACVYATGAAEEVTATAAASDASAQLNDESTFMINCDNEVWIRWGATAPTAASGDFKLEANTILFFGTGGKNDIRFVAARNVASDGSCWVLECQ